MCRKSDGKIFSHISVQQLPPLDKLVLLAQLGIELVKLRLENVSIRQRLATVIQGRKDAQRGILRFGLNGQQDTVVQDTGRHIGKVPGKVVQEILNLLLEESIVDRIGALLVLLHLSCAQNLQKFFFILVSGNFRINLQSLHVRFAKLICFPDAFFNVLSGGAGFLILHMPEPDIERPQQEHQCRKPLLTINDFHFSLIILECHDRAEEIFIVAVKLSAWSLSGNAKEKMSSQRLWHSVSPHAYGRW